MSRILFGLLVVVAMMGCDKKLACKRNSILLHVTLEGRAVGADSLLVTVSTGTTPLEGTAQLGANVTSGTLEIDFAGSYPSGKTTSVTVAAQKNGVTLASNSTSPAPLASGCATLSLDIGASGGETDMSGARDGGDLSPVGDGGDLSPAADAFMPDLMIPTVATARLIAPLSTSTVTQQRPTLRWELGPGAGTPVVDLCTDRSCNTLLSGVTATVAVDNASAKPTMALPSGWVYWRVRVVNGALSTTSPTWQLRVGTPVASTPVDTGNGTVLDVNGDGYADFIVVSFNVSDAAGTVHLYLGEPTGTSYQRIDLTDPDGASANFGRSVTSAGDVNGDGYADFVIGADNASSGAGAAHLYLGEAMPSVTDWNGTTAPKRIDLTNPDDANAQFGHLVSGAGDVNGDGYADFLVGSPNAYSAGGAAHLYLGEATSAMTDWNLPSPAPKRIDLINLDGAQADFGMALAGVGDVDGDGYSDFLIGAGGANTLTGAAHLYFGEATAAATDWNLPSPAPKRIDLANPDGATADFGWSVSGAGDINGDGYADFLVGAIYAPNQGQVHLYLGEATRTPSDWNTGAPPPRRYDLSNPVSGNLSFGYTLASLGDVNGDGYADFLVGTEATSAGGLAQVFLGEATPTASDWNTGGPPPKRIDLITPDGTSGSFGVSLGGAGDVNGDGYDDFLVGAETANSNAGAAHLYFGEGTLNQSHWNTGAPPPKRFDLTNPDGANAYFGAVFASVVDQIVAPLFGPAAPRLSSRSASRDDHGPDDRQRRRRLDWSQLLKRLFAVDFT